MSSETSSLRIRTAIVSLLLFGVFIGVNFDPKVHAVCAKAFGPLPFGIPVLWMVIAWETVLFLPAPWFIHHFMRMISAAISEGRSIRLFSVLVFLFTCGKRYPTLRRSQFIALGGFAYLIAIMAAWIVYASIKGI